MEDIMRTYKKELDNMFACALSNLFADEQAADTLVDFLNCFKKYGNKDEKAVINDFIDGIAFYKEQKIFFGEEEE